MPAVTRLSLSDGRKISVGQLDLCARHNTKLMKLIQPRQRRSAGKVVKGPSRKTSKIVEGPKQRTMLEKEALIERAKARFAKIDKLTPKEMSKLLSIPVWQVHEILGRLMKTGDVVKEGKGRGVSYRRK